MSAPKWKYDENDIRLMNDEIDRLAAENERLKADMAKSCDDGRDGPESYWSCERANRAEAENERLRAALEEYGWHKPTCDYDIPRRGCTCGFEAALAHQGI